MNAIVLVLAAGPAVAGLDHVPIAVRDLPAAAADYRRLGFVLKPGRSHENGIENVHAKFPDGTEIELITAPAARDGLTSRYRRHLESGDGPAFLALHAPGGVEGIQAPDYLFFARLNHSPTDRPEHFAHPNTARTLGAVWLAGELAAERALLRTLGAVLEERTVHVPDPVRATVARFGAGEVYLLPASRAIVPGRPIVGVTVGVTDPSAARRVIERGGVATRAGIGGRPKVFVAPEAAHGLWLELTRVARPPEEP